MGQAKASQGSKDSGILRAKYLHQGWICFKVGSSNQINAVGNRGENGFQVFPNRFGFSGEIHNEGVSSDAGRLARQDSGRNELEGSATHFLAETSEHFFANGFSRLWRDVSYCRTGTPSGHDQATIPVIAEVD